jgi:hypothetical protein
MAAIVKLDLRLLPFEVVIDTPTYVVIRIPKIALHRISRFELNVIREMLAQYPYQITQTNDLCRDAILLNFDKTREKSGTYKLPQP